MIRRVEVIGFASFLSLSRDFLANFAFGIPSNLKP